MDPVRLQRLRPTQARHGSAHDFSSYDHDIYERTHMHDLYFLSKQRPSRAALIVKFMGWVLSGKLIWIVHVAGSLLATNILRTVRLTRSTCKDT
jgi:hypothetical protein